MSRRGRACDSCHSIKIKCELGSGQGDPPCTRCLRLAKDCVITPPMRQKERVAELEAKVEALTRLLEVQRLQSSSPGTSPGRDSTESPKSVKPPSRKRRRALQISSEIDFSAELGKDSSTPCDGYPNIDHVLDKRLQVQIFDKYRQDIEPVFPLASLIAKSNYDTLRAKYPILFHAIIFAASPKVLSAEMEDKVTRIILDLFAPIILQKREK